MKYLMMCFILSLVVLITSPNLAEGTHKSENITWQLVVISSEPACSVDNFRLGDKFQVLIEEYFLLYELNSKYYKPECYSNEKFDWKYKQPENLDLLIILYDRELGRELIHPLGIGGLYAHSGGDITHNHTIIFCDCSSFDFSDTNWILTHELSHFILNYLGFEFDTIENEIHKMDMTYDECVEKEYDDSCKTVGAYLDAERLSHKVKVMKPYEPAIGKEFFPVKNELKIGTKEFEILKNITQWWLEQRITDEEYSDTLKVLTGKNLHNYDSESFLLNSRTTTVIGEPPKDQMKIMNTTSQKMIEKFPFIEAWNTPPILTGNYPDWFKTRAELWTNSTLNDEDFATSITMLEKNIKN